MTRARWSCLVLALGLLFSDRPARGRTPAAFHLFAPTPERRPNEARILKKVVQYFAPQGARPPREDGHLDLAAESLLTWMEAHENAPLPQDLARTEVLLSGATEPAVALFAVTAKSDAQLLPALKSARDKSPLYFTPTHMGLAARGGRAVLLMSRRLLEMAPIARCAQPQESVVLAGRVSHLFNQALILGVQNSDGAIFRRTVDVKEDTFRIVLQGPGEQGPLNIEVMGDVGHGLEIFNHFSVAPCPPRGLPKREVTGLQGPVVENIQRSNAASRAHLRRDIQSLRARAQVRPLIASEALDKLASAHARKMCRTHHFAHRDVQGRDASYRLAKAGISFRWVFENLAVSRTCEGALSQWKESPLHLQNLLDDRADSLGIGVARNTDSNELWVVALLTAAS